MYEDDAPEYEEGSEPFLERATSGNTVEARYSKAIGKVEKELREKMRKK
jgi:hypothetical protein